ncbi:LacI family transcriptional regulator [Phytoactinopolyspora alkaliphila]|uniref:LacI family transcriptional regulator n=1 Tax=Phytoactinopolyspora alkaliphila TaxID=1783498 RepID=A0A6N9YP59_9ACTN|nr:LacI family DNA-binding transcriptional regulator [Phytoactinopolyspora alkaliphila]NED96638.1 LacI family transcriptional regulator [Phytoactinopolyspora alkaliphila]
MRKHAGHTTLKDVAEAAGVSISTVSRAFSNPERLSPATVQHVKEVAARLRFSVNPVAKALITGTSSNIGLVVPDISNPYMSTLLKAAQAHSRGRGIGVFAADTDENASTEREVCDQLAKQTRGLVLCSSRMSVTHIRELAELIPLVLVNRVVKGVPSLYSDSTAALYELVDELVDLGHRHLAYMPGPVQSWTNKQRSRAISKRVAARGAELVTLASTSPSYAGGRAAAPQVLESGATAVMAFDDVLASGLVEGLRRLDCSVPRDISVTGHDDVLAELVYPGITTVTGQSVRIGRLAVDWLLEDPIGDDSESALTRVVEGRVIRRGSVAAPPSPVSSPP